MLCGSLLFLLGYVVPLFAGMYESLDAPMPWFTQIVLGLGLFVRDWWIVLLVVPALLAWWFDRKRRDPAFRARLDEWILGRKLAGSLVAKLDTARLMRTLGTLLKNGVQPLTANGLGRQALPNRSLAGNLAADNGREKRRGSEGEDR